MEAGRRRQEGCPPHTHSRVAAPSAGGTGGLSASQAGPRAGPDSDKRRRWRQPTAPRSLANCWAHFNSNPTKTLTNSNPKKSVKWRKINRLEWRSYLQGSISLRFPFESGGGWSGSRGGEGGAAPWRSSQVGSGGKKNGRRRKRRLSGRTYIRLRRATPHGATQPCHVRLAGMGVTAWQLGRTEACGVTLQGVAPRDLARLKELFLRNLNLNVLLLKY